MHELYECLSFAEFVAGQWDWLELKELETKSVAKRVEVCLEMVGRGPLALSPLGTNLLVIVCLQQGQMGKKEGHPRSVS